MATRVELTQEQVRETIEAKIASIKRARNTSKNPKFNSLYDEELKAFNNALNTLTETK